MYTQLQNEKEELQKQYTETKIKINKLTNLYAQLQTEKENLERQ